LIKPEYSRVTVDARAEQRKIMNEPKKYLEFLNEYLNNTEALILEGQKLIATKVGLKDKKLEESEVALMERGLAQQILMLQSNLRAKVKESMSPSKDVSLEVAKEVIAYQTDMINKRSEDLKQIFSSLERTQESVQIIPMLLALILNDWVFEKYGYEEEDFMKNVQESGNCLFLYFSHPDKPRAHQAVPGHVNLDHQTDEKTRNHPRRNQHLYGAVSRPERTGSPPSTATAATGPAGDDPSRHEWHDARQQPHGPAPDAADAANATNDAKYAATKMSHVDLCLFIIYCHLIQTNISTPIK
jgi:hypothetical protein